jgi:hypothetical protein
MHIASIGIDLGKTTFHLVALGERSKVLVRKKFSRTQLLAYTANLPVSLIGLEACSGAHFGHLRDRAVNLPRIGYVRLGIPIVQLARCHRRGFGSVSRSARDVAN